ncbi:hypothetical protein RO3G_15153 [Rhizopus delemar RA 99-880]|uniref:Uncharacterized protein n=1 Tax=Rhizopus delemar (strain RA 99-880 / ATCC MYA-4621 / FGSC 9543 / NRRL 43880) TaxID=246409 RepID=I1CPR2_RHIO9|nr:hypothetical protein RO3G_15153 [Rhizopus delemar RA 99-880]|eukprot:EIE90442.1 hypothetical protein RO3G_15153 [Rhizopus delemar RA 99-880]
MKKVEKSKNCCKELQNSGFTAGCPWVLHQTISNFDCLCHNRKGIYSSIFGYGQWLLVEFDIAKVADKTGAQKFFSAFNHYYLLTIIAIVMKLY